MVGNPLHLLTRTWVRAYIYALDSQPPGQSHTDFFGGNKKVILLNYHAQDEKYNNHRMLPSCTCAQTIYFRFLL
jgi:hypothetical protein